MKLATAAKSCKKLTDLWGPKKSAGVSTSSAAGLGLNDQSTCLVIAEKLSPRKIASIAKNTSPGKQKSSSLGLSPKSKSILKPKVASKANISPKKGKLGLSDVLIVFDSKVKKVAKENSKENTGSKLKPPPSPTKTCLKEVHANLESVIPEPTAAELEGDVFKNVSHTSKSTGSSKPTARRIYDKPRPLKLPPVAVTVIAPVIEEQTEVFKDLPKPTPVECPITQEIFRDAIMIYDFLETFGSILDTKRYMGGPTSMEIITKILYDSDLEGPLSKLLEMLIDAAYGDGSKVGKYKDLHQPSFIQWEKIRQIPCDPYILSELVRLHILRSRKTKSRRQYFIRNVQEKDAVDFLQTKSVFELSPEERVIIIEELMQYLLSLPPYSQLAWNARCELKRAKQNLKIIKKLKEHENQDAALDTLIHMKIIKEAFPVEIELGLPSDPVDGSVENKPEVSLTGGNTDLTTQPEVKIIKEAFPVEIELGLPSDPLDGSVENKPEVSLTGCNTDLTTQPEVTGGNTHLTTQPKVPVQNSLEVKPSEALMPAASKSEMDPAARLRKEMITKEGFQKVLKRFEEKLGKQFKKFTAPIYLGCDREYRRYWVFRPMPFLLVENDCCTTSLSLERDSEQHVLDPADNEKDEVKQSSTTSSVFPDEQKVADATEMVTKWAFYSQKESIDQLLENFSSKVFPESGLKEKMAYEKERLVELLETCPAEDPWKSVFENKPTGRRPRRSRSSSASVPKIVEDAQEVMEKCLIEALMENEEKLRVGWLGGIKENVEDWQNALVGREYEKFTNACSEDSRPQVVAAYSNALLKLKHSVRSSYFRLCFEKDPSDCVNVRTLMSEWEAYVKKATSLSQLFLSLTLFERSIHWDASLSEAICRICLSKNAEGMLLCDKCDRGYHMACLEPQIEEVPEGSWFCDQCEKSMVKAEKNCEHSAEEKLMMSCLSCCAVIEFCMGCHDSKLPTSVLCLSCGNRTVTKTAKILRVQPKLSKTRSGKQLEKRSSERIRKIALCTMSTSLQDERPKESRRNIGTRLSLRKAEKTPKKMTRKRWQSESDSEEEVVIKRTRSSRRIRADRQIQELLDEPNSSSCTSSQEILDLKVCEEIMSKLIVHKDSASFLMCDNRSQNRKYYTIIKNPMDLTTVRSNLRTMVYHSNSELINDVQLIFDNCKAYYKNPRNADYRSARRLETFFNELLDKYELASGKKE